MDNRDTDSAMSDAILAEMQSIVRTAAQPWAPGDSVKAGILRASRKLGLSYRRTRTFWYGASCAVLAAEADRLRRAELAFLAQRRATLTTELKAIAARLADKETAEHAATADDRAATNENRIMALCQASRAMDEPGQMVRRARVNV